MAGLTAKHLYDELKKIVESGKGDSKVFFDSEAVCFETHLVEIEGVSFDSDEETGLGDQVTLHWSMQTQPFFHFTAEMENKLTLPVCSSSERAFLDELREKGKIFGTDDPAIEVGEWTQISQSDFTKCNLKELVNE